MKTKKDADTTTAPIVEPPAETKPPEVWAEERGWLPRMLEGGGSFPRPNPHYWKFAATRALKGWTEGQQVTKAEFDAAVAEQDALRFG